MAIEAVPDKGDEQLAWLQLSAVGADPQRG
jgi:hypothetical protein